MWAPGFSSAAPSSHARPSLHQFCSTLLHQLPAEQIPPITYTGCHNLTASLSYLKERGSTLLDRDGLHRGEVSPIDYAIVDFDVSTLVKYLNSLHRNTSLLHLLSHELHGIWFDEDLSFRMRFKFELNHDIIPSCSFELTFIK